ncbi:MAG: response regulator, partial [Luteitalea sp.]
HLPGEDGFWLLKQLRQHHPAATPAALLMLTSDRQVGDIARCHSLGITAHLTKPVRPRDLAQAIQQALGTGESISARAAHIGGAPPAVAVAAPMPSAEAPATAAVTEAVTAGAPRRTPLRVLLAEDNAVNQQVAVAMLKKGGHHVFVADNGAHAADAIAREPFDVVLMDVQMPDVNGFEATARVRDRERTTGGRIPIVAMTAHAMTGDRERCLDAGMDGYLTKPITFDALMAAVERYGAATGHA